MDSKVGRGTTYTIEMSVFQAATHLLISAANVTRQIQAGALPGYRKPFGTYVVVLPSDEPVETLLRYRESAASFATRQREMKAEEKRLRAEAERRRDLEKLLSQSLSDVLNMNLDLKESHRLLRDETEAVLQSEPKWAPASYAALMRWRRIRDGNDAELRIRTYPKILESLESTADESLSLERKVRSVYEPLRALGNVYAAGAMVRQIGQLLSVNRNLTLFISEFSEIESHEVDGLFSGLPAEARYAFESGEHQRAYGLRNYERVSERERMNWNRESQEWEEKSWGKLVLAGERYGYDCNYPAVQAARLRYQLLISMRGKPRRDKAALIGPRLRRLTYAQFERGGRICGLCRQVVDPEESTAVHHVKPVAAGGATEEDNLCVVHAACNQAMSGYAGWIIRRVYDSLLAFRADQALLAQHGYKSSVRELPDADTQSRSIMFVVTYRGRPSWNSEPPSRFAPEHSGENASTGEEV